MSTSLSKKRIKEDCRFLQKWLSIDGKTKPLLATKLGYKSSAVIDQWLHRGIAKRERKKVLEIITKDIKYGAIKDDVFRKS